MYRHKRLRTSLDVASGLHAGVPGMLQNRFGEAEVTVCGQVWSAGIIR
jgi:hypothetical protein